MLVNEFCSKFTVDRQLFVYFMLIKCWTVKSFPVKESFMICNGQAGLTSCIQESLPLSPSAFGVPLILKGAHKGFAPKTIYRTTEVWVFKVSSYSQLWVNSLDWSRLSNKILYSSGKTCPVWMSSSRPSSLSTFAPLSGDHELQEQSVKKEWEPA